MADINDNMGRLYGAFSRIDENIGDEASFRSLVENADSEQRDSLYGSFSGAYKGYDGRKGRERFDSLMGWEPLEKDRRVSVKDGLRAEYADSIAGIGGAEAARRLDGMEKPVSLVRSAANRVSALGQAYLLATKKMRPEKLDIDLSQFPGREENVRRRIEAQELRRVATPYLREEYDEAASALREKQSEAMDAARANGMFGGKPSTDAERYAYGQAMTSGAHLSDNEAAAAAMYDEAAKIYESPMRGEGGWLGRFGGGAEARVTDAGFLDAKDTKTNLLLRGVLTKMGEGRTLTDSERMLLDAYEERISAQMSRGDNMATLYKGGQGAADSAKFMAEMALTGGVLKGVGGAVAKKAAERFGVEMSGKLAGKSLGEMAKRYGAQVVGDMAAVPVNMMLHPTTYEGISEELIGFDGDGRLNGVGKAVARGLYNAFREEFSETFGERLEKLGEIALQGNAAKLFKAYRGSGMHRALNAAGVQGNAGEILEEVYGAGMDAAVGYITDNRLGDDDALREFTKADNMATMLSSFAPMFMLGGTANMASIVSAKRDLNASMKALESLKERYGLEASDLGGIGDALSRGDIGGAKNGMMSLVREARGKGMNIDDARSFVQSVEDALIAGGRMALEEEAAKDAVATSAGMSDLYGIYVGFNNNAFEADNASGERTQGFVAEANDRYEKARRDAEAKDIDAQVLDLDAMEIESMAQRMFAPDSDEYRMHHEYAMAKMAKQAVDDAWREESDAMAADSDALVDRMTQPKTGYMIATPGMRLIVNDPDAAVVDGRLRGPMGGGSVFSVYDTESGDYTTMTADEIGEVIAYTAGAAKDERRRAIDAAQKERYDRERGYTSQTRRGEMDHELRGAEGRVIGLADGSTAKVMRVGGGMAAVEQYGQTRVMPTEQFLGTVARGDDGGFVMADDAAEERRNEEKNEDKKDEMPHVPSGDVGRDDILTEADDLTYVVDGVRRPVRITKDDGRSVTMEYEGAEEPVVMPRRTFINGAMHGMPEVKAPAAETPKAENVKTETPNAETPKAEEPEVKVPMDYNTASAADIADEMTGEAPTLEIAVGDAEAQIALLEKELKKLNGVATKSVAPTDTKGREARAKAVTEMRAVTAMRDKFNEVKAELELRARNRVRDEAMKPVDNGGEAAAQEAKARFEEATKAQGLDNMEITTADGSVIRGHYELVSPAALTPSHNPLDGYSTTVGFPEGFGGENANSRDYRGSRTLQEQVEERGRHFDGRALDDIPVVSPEGVVYSGNGRVMSAQLATANGTRKDYDAALATRGRMFGFGGEQTGAVPDGMVVFVTDELYPYNQTFFHKFNQRAMNSESAADTAKRQSLSLGEEERTSIARVIDDYETLEGFFRSPEGTKRMWDVLMRYGIVTAADRGQYVNEDNGLLSAAGKEYVSAVLLGSMLDKRTLEDLSEQQGLRNTLLKCAAAILDNGQLNGFSLKDEIQEAVRVVIDARQNGTTVDGILSQGNMIDGYGYNSHDNTVLMLALAFEEGVSSLRDMLMIYNREAAVEAQGQMSFLEPVTSEDIVRKLLDDFEYGKKYAGAFGRAADVRERTSGYGGAQGEDAVQGVEPDARQEGGEVEDRVLQSRGRRRDARLYSGNVNAARELAKKLGVEVTVVEGPADVEDAAVRSAIEGGAAVEGWYDVNSGRVYLYAPMFAGIGISRAEGVVLHEVVAHKGLRGIFGTEKRYDAFCDAVWDGMGEDARKEELGYAYNARYASVREALESGREMGVRERALYDRWRREAADEYVAHVAQREDGFEVSVWKRICEAVKRILRSMGVDVKIDDDSLRVALIRSRRALEAKASGRVVDDMALRREAKRIAGTADEYGAAADTAYDINDLGAPLSRNGQEEIATSGDGAVAEMPDGRRYSIRAARTSLKDSPMLADLVESGMFTQKEADDFAVQMEGLLEFMTPFAYAIDSNETYGAEGRKFFPYKPNSDRLYKISLDFSTLCTKRIMQQYVIEQLQLMLKDGRGKLTIAKDGEKSGRILSAEHQLAIRKLLKKYSIEENDPSFDVACAMCYVESARLKGPEQQRRWIKERGDIMLRYFADKDKEYSRKVKDFVVEWKRTHYYTDEEGRRHNYIHEDGKPYTKDEMKEASGSAESAEAMYQAQQRFKMKYRPTAEEKGIIEEAKRLRKQEFMTVEALTSLMDTHPEVYEAYVNFMRNATHSKGLERYEPYYYGDSRLSNGKNQAVSDKFIDAVNRENGMRFQSWSDWRVQTMLDYVIAVCDLAVRGAKMHGYTKFVDEVRVLGRTGMMFNMSGVPGGRTGLNAKGELLWSERESVNADEARSARLEFPETAGFQCIGAGREHILTLMRTDWIDYIIPYHRSGLSKDLRRIAEISNWHDYEGVQNAKAIKDLKRPDGMSEKEWQVEPVFSEFFDEAWYRDERYMNRPDGGMAAMRLMQQRYVDMCNERGLVPKFSEFLGNVNADGTYSIPEVDGQPINYWKLLIDRKMINQETGALIEQKPVKPVFDFSVMRKMVEKGVADYERQRNSIRNALDYTVRNLGKVSGIVSEAKKRKDDPINERDYVVRNIPSSVKDIANTPLSIVGMAPVDGGGGVRYSMRELADIARSASKAASDAKGSTEEEAEAYANNRFSRVPDGELHDRLMKELEGVEGVDWVWAYRAARKIDGKYYSPKMTKLAGDMNPIAMGVLEQSDEHPELAYEVNGKWKVDLDGNGVNDTKKVDYNPYIHTSTSVLNDQFSGAYKDPSLVVIRTKVPRSGWEAEKAEKANLAPGWHPWNGGVIDAKLMPEDKREVMLTKYDMPVEEVPVEEVADKIADILKRNGLDAPFNVFTPGLADALTQRGIRLFRKNRDDGTKVKSYEKPFNDYLQRNGIRFSRANESQRMFVSNAERAVESLDMGKASPEQWLKAVQGRGGVKAGEDRWLGLSEWLQSSDRKSLTKDEVLQFIRANMIRIEEQGYSENANAAQIREDYIRESIGGGMSLEELQGKVDANAESADRYDMEREPGFDLDGYLMDCMTDEFGDDFADGYNIVDGEIDYNNDPWNFDDDELPSSYEGVRPINSTRMMYTTKGLVNNREIALTVPSVEPYNRFDEVHFGDAGDGRAIAWIRFGETADSDGGRVLVIDEIQSKRHQDGRDGADVPDAPFGKNWHELAMKRMLRLAAEEGYDKVAWTNGGMQSKRYGLVNKIMAVDVSRTGEGEYYVVATNTRGNIVSGAGGDMDAERMSQIYGKGLASMMIERADAADGKEVTLTPDDLRIGGEGMKGFYDEMLPRFMDRYGKQWGVKTRDIELPVGDGGWHAVDVTPEMSRSVMEGQVMFSTGVPTSVISAQEAYERAVLDRWNNIQYEFQDRQQYVRAAIEAIIAQTKSPVMADNEDYLTVENHMSSVSDAQKEIYLRDYYTPLVDEVNAMIDGLLKARGWRNTAENREELYDEISDYMMAKHGLERNEYYNAKAERELRHSDIVALAGAIRESMAEHAKDADDYRILSAVDRGRLTEEDRRRLAALKASITRYQNEHRWDEEILGIIGRTWGDDALTEGAVRRFLAEKEMSAENIFHRYEDRDWSGLTGLYGFDTAKRRKELNASYARGEMTEETLAQEMKRLHEEDVRNLAEATYLADRNTARFEGETDTEKLWRLTNRATHRTLDHRYETGQMSAKRLDDMKRMFDYYVPLRGFSEDIAEDVYDYDGPNSNNYIKQDAAVHGRTSKARGPIAMIMAMADSEISSGNRNVAKQALLNFVQNRPDNDLMQIRDVWFEKVPDTDEEGNLALDGGWHYEMRLPEIREGMSGSEIAQAWADYEGMMRNMEAEGRATLLTKSVDAPYRIVHRRMDAEHCVLVKTGDDVKCVVVMGDNKAARAVNGDFGEKGGAEALRGMNRFVSSMFTNYSMDFTVRNFIRDQIYANTTLLNKEGLRYVMGFERHVAENFAKMMPMYAAYGKGKLKGGNLSRTERDFVDFVENGGKTGYTIINNVRKHEEDLMRMVKGRSSGGVVTHGIGAAMTAVPKAISLLNEAAELLTRFSAYQASRDAGRSVQRSVSDAKNVSVNFNTRGAQSGRGFWGGVARYLGFTKFFFNAGVQGMQNFAKNFKEHPVKMTATAGLYVAAGAMMPFVNRWLAEMFGDDPDEYYKLPAFVRHNSIVVGIHGRYMVIPLPIELRALYGMGGIVDDAVHKETIYENPGAVAMDCVAHAADILPLNPLEGARGVKDAKYAAADAVTPDVLSPLLQHVTNRDFTGAPLYKDNMFNQNAPLYTKAFSGAPRFLVSASKALYEAGLDSSASPVSRTDWLNPEVADNYLSGIFGGQYKLVKDIARNVELFGGGETLAVDAIPMIGVLSKEVDEEQAARRIRQQYYDYGDIYEKWTESAKAVYGLTPSQAYGDKRGKLSAGQRERRRRFENTREYDALKAYYEASRKVRKLKDTMKESGEGSGAFDNAEKEMLDVMETTMDNIKKLR